jgi:protein TonB
MMESIGKPVAAPARTYRGTAVSAALHLAVFSVLVHQARHFVAPIRYPGAANGHNIVLSYLPGRAPKPAVAPPPKTKPLEIKSKIALHQPEKLTPTQTSPNKSSPASEHPDSTSGADALGSGNIDIALAKFFPRPKPDLSSLPSGTKGDVILDIVIDETGKISDLKLVKGIAQSVDETVIATVRQWTFNPANRDGQPIASEQELHFHYEKG